MGFWLSIWAKQREERRKRARARRERIKIMREYLRSRKRTDKG